MLCFLNEFCIRIFAIKLSLVSAMLVFIFREALLAGDSMLLNTRYRTFELGTYYYCRECKLGSNTSYPAICRRGAMAPIKTANNKTSLVKPKKGSKTSSPTGLNSKSRISKKAKALPSKQQKTKPAPAPVKKKRRVYTEKELGIPKLNMITPAGVVLPKGKRKGKVFVDDQVINLSSFFMTRRINY